MNNCPFTNRKGTFNWKAVPAIGKRITVHAAVQCTEVIGWKSYGDQSGRQCGSHSSVAIHFITHGLAEYIDTSTFLRIHAGLLQEHVGLYSLVCHSWLASLRHVHIGEKLLLHKGSNIQLQMCPQRWCVWYLKSWWQYITLCVILERDTSCFNENDAGLSIVWLICYQAVF